MFNPGSRASLPAVPSWDFGSGRGFPATFAFPLPAKRLRYDP
jgi:hypothetical protein